MPMTTRLMIPAPPYPELAEDGQCVRADRCADASEPRSEVQRRDQLQQAAQRLRELIEQGINSGLGQALTTRRAAGLKHQALGNLR